MAGSSGEHYVIRGGVAGFDRLLVLARTWAATTESLFDRIGVGPGHACVDLGSGAGDVTLALARRVGPSGRVVGVDMDEVKVGLARERAEAEGLTNVEFVVDSVYEWSGDGGFDLAYCRFVLQHLSRPVDLLRTMGAAVGPDGVVATEDADFEGSFCHPPNAAFDFWVSAYQRALVAAGGDPRSGLALHERFLAAGLAAPELTVVQHIAVTGEAKTMPYRTIESTAETILAEGIATPAELESALAGLSALASDDTTVVGTPRTIQAWSRR